MKTMKRIMSFTLVFLILLSVCSTGFTSVAADVPGVGLLKEIVLVPEERPETQFYCTEVTRVAKGPNLLEHGDTIVKATPSGVPELSGTYVTQAYAGETPTKTTVTFVPPKVGILVNGISCNNSSVVLSGIQLLNGNYVVTVESGTAVKKEDGTYEPLVFTIDYTWSDGNVYQERCVSYIESIVTGGSYVEAQSEIKGLSGTGEEVRLWASASTRLLGKGVYYERPENLKTSEDPFRTYGIYNVATGTPYENLSSGYNTVLYSEYTLEKPSGKKDKVHDVFASELNTAHIYIDSSSVKTLADMNLRLDSNAGSMSSKNNSDPYTALEDMWVWQGIVTEKPAPDENGNVKYENDSLAQSAIGLNIPDKKDYGVTQPKKNSAMKTLTGKSRNGGHISTYVLNGNVADLVDGSSYTVVSKYYSYLWFEEGVLQHYNMTSIARVPTAMTFHIVDKGALRDMINYVMYSAPEKPDITAEQKGINPQSWYYKSGYSGFPQAYTNAFTVLNNPRATQGEIDKATTALKNAYDKLKLKSADYTEVNELSKIADKILQNEGCYPGEDIILVREAKKLVAKNYSIFYQDAVDTMAYNLRLAIEKADPLAADYRKIQALEKEFYSMNHSDYTTVSVDNVKAAFAKVDYTLTALEQSQVSAWEEEIRKALDELVMIPADFTRLIENLNTAKEFDCAFYVNGDLLQEAVKDAEEALSDNEKNPWPISRQTEIDTLADNLKEKTEGLIVKDAEKNALKAAIDAEVSGDLLFYNQVVLSEYYALAEEAIGVYEDTSLTIFEQQTVDAITDALRQKYDELMSTYLVIYIDLSELNEAIDSASEIDRDLYCKDEAMAELDSAVEEALMIVEENPSEKEENILKVEASIERINTAIAGLNLHEEKEAVSENIVSPTCTESGSHDEVVYCRLCDEKLMSEAVTDEPLGHAPEEAVKENEIPAAPDEDGFCEWVVYCGACGEELSREGEILPALGHTPAEAIEENRIEPTCTEKGSYEMVVYCNCCENKKELKREFSEISATGHTESDPVTENEVPKTCFVDGSYDTVVYCAICEEELSRQTVIVTALGRHVADKAVEENRIEPTCTEEGSYNLVVYCRICKESVSREVQIIEKTAHNYDSGTVTPPTCTEDGYTIYSCLECGYEHTDNKIGASHTEAPAIKENEVAPTCTETGSYQSVIYCQVCGEELYREIIEISATGHSEGKWVVTKEADIDVEGEEKLYCTNEGCGEVLDTKIIPAIKAYFKADETKSAIIDKERGLIYGLEEGIYDLEGFVECKGGELEYKESDEGFGTGTVVNFIVDGKIAETYTIIIFGDITGDGVIDTYDTTKLAQIVNGDIDVEDGTAIALAADIALGDGVSDTYDLTKLYQAVNGDITISQVTQIA